MDLKEDGEKIRMVVSRSLLQDEEREIAIWMLNGVEVREEWMELKVGVEERVKLRKEGRVFNSEVMLKVVEGYGVEVE